MAARKPIVGIVGATGEVTSSETSLAKSLGWIVADHDLMVLTGGRLLKDDEGADAVKDAALLGAQSHASNRGRIIGILPSRDSGGKIGSQLDEGRRCLYVYTRLSADQRNVINGFTPDVMIALRGGAGTLTEIGFALYNHRRVVFLDSLEYLAAKLKAKRQEVRQKLLDAQTRYSEIDAAEVFRCLEDLLVKQADSATVAGDVREAVIAAKDFLMGPSGDFVVSDSFPELAGYTGTKSDFEEKLYRLSNL